MKYGYRKTSELSRRIYLLLKEEGPMDSLTIRERLSDTDPEAVKAELRKMKGRCIRRITSGRQGYPVYEAV